MNTSLSYVNSSLELHVVSTFWLRSDTSDTFSLHLLCPAIRILERPALENDQIMEQRTDIFSCTFSVKVFLMLDNPFLVPSLCKLNHISLCFIQISTKSPAKLVIPFRESTVFFWSHRRCFGSLSKFQHNMRRPVSPDYPFLVTMIKSSNKRKTKTKTKSSILKRYPKIYQTIC